MSNGIENTVVISLDKYEEMKSEIKRLQELVKQKEIVKYRNHWSLDVAFAVLILFAIFFFFTKMP